MALFWIQRSLKDLEDHPSPNYSASVKDDDFYEWTATITGPKATLNEGSVFSLGIYFSTGFMLKPPKVFFKTPIFHPSVSHGRDIFHPMLMNDTWCMTTTVGQMLMTLQDMLIHPRVEETDVVREEAAVMFHNDKVQFDEFARSWTQLHAID
ncbi:hypothetical protein EUTSA_v10009334mg [Eutrema salsugineum]|uniref:UBC core domain-containing protein n=1 Tax=Eutrema salsugineum TaxID=72664 RepID=V4KTL4_EUTSA|nr:ubiquitin-conjugating enzyme E2 D1 [Eutrema salsugineum]ESQ33372.1 hypothetical protein EUTSA_v10009334mg [Eutrema salsugineum]